MIIETNQERKVHLVGCYYANISRCTVQRKSKRLPFVFFFFWDVSQCSVVVTDILGQTSGLIFKGQGALKWFAEVSGQPIDPIFKSQTDLDCVTKVLGRTDCSETSVATNKRCVTSQKSEELIYTVVETCSSQGRG
jgi:hypothetical protein